MPILESLKNIPVYVILNGRGEIVVANSFNKFDNKETTLSFANNLYDFCGDFEGKIKMCRLIHC